MVLPPFRFEEPSSDRVNRLWFLRKINCSKTIVFPIRGTRENSRPDFPAYRHCAHHARPESKCVLIRKKRGRALVYHQE